MFHFTPSSGRAQVETRLRFEDFSFVRAVAEMNDGKLYMSQRWVKAAGGCSAPNAKNFVPEALLGKMKLRFDDDSVTYGKPTGANEIPHPNEPRGGGLDGEKVPKFVRSVKVLRWQPDGCGGELSIRTSNSVLLIANKASENEGTIPTTKIIHRAIAEGARCRGRFPVPRFPPRIS